MTILDPFIEYPTILASTSRWCVVAKPAGWLTVPPSCGTVSKTDRGTTQVLVDWLRKEIGPVWTVHRLDIQTSGVVLFAKSAADHRQASIWFQQRQMKKKYVFLAMGRPLFPMLRCNEPIRGVAALTQIEVKEIFDSVFYGVAVPQTGRRHQIRIHLAQRGFPIAGDIQYGGQESIGDLTVCRVALHAQQLRLPNGEVFEAALPKDFLDWLSYCRHKSIPVQ